MPTTHDTPRQNPPVFLMLQDALRAERLSRELRRHGFATRVFDDPSVLRRALADEAPPALLIESEALTDDLPATAPLIVLACADTFAARLAAVRAGSHAFYPEPVDVAALAQRLARMSADPAPARVLLAGSKMASLARIIATLDLPDIRLRHWSDPQAALAELAAGDTALLLVADTRPAAEPEEFVAVVRQHSGPELPVLLLAADRSLDARLAAAGVDAVIDPEDMTGLATVVRARVQRARQLRTLAASAPAIAEAVAATVAPVEIAAAAVAGSAAEAPAPTRPSSEDAAQVARIRAALAEDRFRLVYQPISSLSGAPTAFYEVFVRMLDERGADIQPLEFVPVIDRQGLGPELDRWVIGRALRVLAEQRSLRHSPILFVKLLTGTVCDPAFPDWLRERVHASGLEPDRLVLQVAHRSATAHPAQTRELLQALRAAGFRTALEHYAEADAAHPLLTMLPLDFVKLSRQLTHDLTENRQHQLQVQAITGQCRTLEIHSVAALVQDALTLSVLWRCGVEYIQGYFMQEPADVFDTAERLV